MMITASQQKKRINELIKLDNQTDKMSDADFDICMAYIRDHLLQFYQRYADDNGLSINQVQGQVSKWDMQQWQQAIQSIDMTDWPKEATARAKIYSVMAGVDKPNLLNAIVALGLLSLTVKQRKYIKQRVKQDGMDEIKRMETAFDLTPRQVKKVSSVITSQANVDVWSDNLWLTSDTLANDVQNLVNKYLRHGITLSELENKLSKYANPNQFKPEQSINDRVKQMQFNTRRIVRTESARLVNQANLATYRIQGIKQVQLITEPGHCDTCGEIASHNPYELENAPDVPIHPNCRCNWIPIE